MRAKRRWAAFAVTVGLLGGSVGGGIAVGASGGDAMKKSSGDAMHKSSGDAMKKSSDDAMQQQDAAASGAAMSAAHMTG
jgi:hypothetical protein